MSDQLNFDPTVLGELIARRWQEGRAYYTLNRKAHGAWLKPSWTRPAGQSGLELHWSRGAPLHPGSELTAPE